MGSGLILLVIVGAWLAVLVPMGLRAHDSTAPSRSAEHDRARVLSRRPGAPVPELEDELDDDPPSRLGDAVGQARERWSALRSRRRGPLPLAVRRRRVLVTLVGTAVATWLLGLVGPGWLHAVSGACAVAALLFVVHCRRQVLVNGQRTHLRHQLEAELQRRGVEDLPVARRVPARVPAPTAVLATAGRAAEAAPVAAPVRHALGDAWQPVPVPLPTYVGKPAAPQPAAPAASASGTVLDERRSEPHEPGTEAAGQDDRTAVLDRRRVVGGW